MGPPPFPPPLRSRASSPTLPPPHLLLRTGQLRSLKIGKLRRITEQQLAEFITSLDKAI